MRPKNVHKSIVHIFVLACIFLSFPGAAIKADHLPEVPDETVIPLCASFGDVYLGQPTSEFLENHPEAICTDRVHGLQVFGDIVYT
jgi:hypothetical protein